MSDKLQETDVQSLREKKIQQLQQDFRKKADLVISGAREEEFLGVENSHDYPELLRIWLNNSTFSTDEKNAVLLKLLEHENLHAVPALGKVELGIEVIYGIHFVKNPNGGVDTIPDTQINTPEQINVLTPEGEEIAVTIFEVVLNPVLVNVEQEFSEMDRYQIVRYLTIFKPFNHVYDSLMEIFKRLPEDEQKIILSRL